MKCLFKKIISLLMVVTLCLSLGANVSAEKLNVNNPSKINEARKYVNELDINMKKINEMIEVEGMTKDEAMYYYKLDELVKYLENNNIVLDFTEVVALSDAEVVSNPSLIKEKILDIDLRAIKKALQSSVNSENDREKLEKLIEKNKGKDIKNYEFKTSDGNKIVYTATKEETDKVEKQIQSNDSNLVQEVESDVLGYKESEYYSGTVDETSTWECTTEWKYYYGVAYAKIYLNDKMEVNLEDETVLVTYVNGSGAAYGIIHFQNSTGGATNSANGTATSPAVTSNQVTFEISASVAGSIELSVGVGVGLSISVTAGVTWTSHIYDKQWGTGVYKYYAGRYL